LVPPKIVKVAACGYGRRPEMASETLEWVAFGFTETAVCEPLKESIDRSSLDMIAWPIHKAFSDFCDCGEFSGVITLDGVRRIAAE
jgi:hypothetical protein